MGRLFHVPSRPPDLVLQVEFHSPIHNMELTENEVIRRQDPLTGAWAIGGDGVKARVSSGRAWI